MKRCLYFLTVLFALSLLIATWSTPAAAQTPPRAVNGSAPAMFQAPTATPAPPAADAQENSPNLILGILILFGGMILLLVLGIGAAILLVRLRDRIR